MVVTAVSAYCQIHSIQVSLLQSESSRKTWAFKWICQLSAGSDVGEGWKKGSPLGIEMAGYESRKASRINPGLCRRNKTSGVSRKCKRPIMQSLLTHWSSDRKSSVTNAGSTIQPCNWRDNKAVRVSGRRDALHLYSIGIFVQYTDALYEVYLNGHFPVSFYFRFRRHKTIHGYSYNVLSAWRGIEYMNIIPSPCVNFP